MLNGIIDWPISKLRKLEENEVLRRNWKVVRIDWKCGIFQWFIIVGLWPINICDIRIDKSNNNNSKLLLVSRYIFFARFKSCLVGNFVQRSKQWFWIKKNDQIVKLWDYRLNYRVYIISIFYRKILTRRINEKSKSLTGLKVYLFHKRSH